MIPKVVNRAVEMGNTVNSLALPSYSTPVFGLSNLPRQVVTVRFFIDSW